jgi:leucyl aminopeptidase
MIPVARNVEGDLSAHRCDALLVGTIIESELIVSRALQEVEPDLGSSLDGFMEATGYGSQLGETRTVATFGRIGPRAIVLIGLGDPERLTASGLRSALAQIARDFSDVRRIVSALHLELQDDTLAQASVSGLLLGLARREDSDLPSASLEIASGSGVLRRAAISAKAIDLVRGLVNEPPSSLTPTRWAERAQDLAGDAGLECSVWGAEELERKGFGGLIAVARGSQQEPKLIHLRYRPPDAETKIVLAGKGVTFDAGGINLKLDRDALSYMKFDMAGGATVMGCMTALSALGVRAQVDGLIPAAANLPGPYAILPGDVIRQYGGATTEVTDTDSEGRLLLADALSYATQLGADIIVDVATLTETTERALGPEITGLFSNDQQLAEELLAAGTRAGEPMWQLPLHAPYAMELRSSVADVRNQSLADGFVGGAIKAALFLSRFIGPGVGWAHLDIAGTAYQRNFSDPTIGGATGVPTGALLEWLGGR